MRGTRRTIVRGKVFGLGLSKTGTTSLAAALNILGVKTIHFPHDEQTLSELKNAEYRLSILDDYDGAVDAPIPPYFAQLDVVYPGSKFILTIREKTSWLRSVEQHWTRRANKRRRRELSEFDAFVRAVVFGTVGFNPDRFSYVYDTHERNVREYFKDRPGDLLILDICGGDGWDALCEFLGLPVPPVPFPHERKGDNRLAASGTA
jgi:hypothetical protein